MAVNIVTGMTGKAHITSDDDRAKNVLSFGTGKYVMDYGKKFETSILSNNQIRVRDGMCINQGTQMGIELNDYEDVTIENGVSGSNRNDLIVMRYERNADTSIEKASLVVIRGETGSTATDPSYNSGNILDGGDLIDDMPLYRVKIESLSIIAVEPLFSIFTEDDRKKLVGLENVDNTPDAEKEVLKAKQDGNGNVIADTYTTKEEFNNLESDCYVNQNVDRNNIISANFFTVIQSNINTRSLYFPCKQNTKYKVTRSVFGKRFSIALSDDISAGIKVYNLVENDENQVSEVMINTENHNYILVYYYASIVDTISEETLRNSIDIFTTNVGENVDALNENVSVIGEVQDTLEAEIQALDDKLTTNLLKPTQGTITKYGVTCTYEDGTYTLDGTATSDMYLIISNINNVDKNKNYRLCGCPSGGSLTTYFLQYSELDDSGAVVSRKFDTGDSSNFTDKPEKGIAIIVVIAGTTVSNLVFKPMITTNLNATYDDFVPYTGSTGQINSDVAEIKAQVGEYKMGNACEKGVSTSVLSGDTNLVTGDAVSKAIFSATNYEEGIFTPKFRLVANGDTLETTNNNYGYYKRFGNMVHIRAFTELSSSITVNGNAIYFVVFPYIPCSSTNIYFAHTIQVGGIKISDLDDNYIFANHISDSDSMLIGDGTLTAYFEERANDFIGKYIDIDLVYLV